MPKRKNSKGIDTGIGIKKCSSEKSVLPIPVEDQSVSEEQWPSCPRVPLSAEHERLTADQKDPALGWRQWGPYLSERQWGTVREDYSPDGNCWEHFGHDTAPARAYRWGEDGLCGWSDDSAQLCMSLALWNGKDQILKERLFGLTGPQGNHGEDVKECYYYLESTPSHSYNRMLYKYPQAAFPYTQLIEVNSRRGPGQDEYELLDTGVFKDDKYWDVFAEYVKVTPHDMLCQYTVCNRGTRPATVQVLPQLCFRNTWSWSSSVTKPVIITNGPTSARFVSHCDLGNYVFDAVPLSATEQPELLYTENDSNQDHLSATKHMSSSEQTFTKDAFHRYIIKGEKSSVNPALQGTKVAAYYKIHVKAHASVTVRCRLRKDDGSTPSPLSRAQYDEVVNQRRRDCDLFYQQIIPRSLSHEEQNVARQAYAGLCYSKQYFHYHVAQWAEGRKHPVNNDWKHMLNHDVILMPDKWEFPWYATWDLAFHVIPFCFIDPEFAKQQLLLFLNGRYMHPNGQLPACEFNLSDVNPPVHAWACLQVYRTSNRIQGYRDTSFLKKAFHKLILNFSWWVNKKDCDGRHIFHGGFLGLDNISCVDRSNPPKGISLEQADGTSWMAFFCVSMVQIAVELACTDDVVYEDMAIKFLDHFSLIKTAINDEDNGLWDREDTFYYDRLTKDNGKVHVLRVRSLVGLSSMFAACVLVDHAELKNKLPAFYHRLNAVCCQEKTSPEPNISEDGCCLLTVPTKHQLVSLLEYLLDDAEFLSPHGIRSLSKVHNTMPVGVSAGGTLHTVEYCPGESNCDMFGGNSNWRGPVWFCMNYLIVEALDTYGRFYGSGLTVDYPRGSGCQAKLCDVATDIRKRLVSIFLPDNAGKRPVHGSNTIYATNVNWQNLVLFYEYFHGESGRGCGASHQTGWTALVVNFLSKLSDSD